MKRNENDGNNGGNGKQAFHNSHNSHDSQNSRSNEPTVILSLRGDYHTLLSYQKAEALQFGASKEAELAGLLHDLGKYGDFFQARLAGKERGIDHWSIRALRFERSLVEAGGVEPLAYVVKSKS